MSIPKTRFSHRCNKCSYGWYSSLEKPKSCPNCKQYTWRNHVIYSSPNELNTEYKPLITSSGIYFISSTGKVFSAKRNKFLSIINGKVALPTENKTQFYKIEDLVDEYFNKTINEEDHSDETTN